MFSSQSEGQRAYFSFQNGHGPVDTILLQGLPEGSLVGETWEEWATKYIFISVRHTNNPIIFVISLS